jgi:hypothetical protein
MSEPERARDRGFLLAALGLTGLAALLRFWGLSFGLPHLEARPDETEVLMHAARLAQGVRDLEWGMYPDAYVYLSWLWGELFVRIGGALGALPASDYEEIFRHHREQLHLAGRVLTAVAGTLTVPVVMLAARRGLGTLGAGIAGLFVATSFLCVRESHAAKPDALLTFFVAVTLAASVALLRRPGLARAVLAGLGLGAATATKYPGFVTAFPIYAACVLTATGPLARRIVPRHALVAGATGVALFVLLDPLLVTGAHFWRFASDFLALVFPSFAQPGGESLFPATAVLDAPARSRYAPSAWWGGWAYHASFSLRYGAGWPATLLALPALVWGCVSRNPVGRVAAAFALPWFLVMGLSSALLSRYMTPMIPALALLEAQLVVDLARRVAPRRTTLVAALVALAVAAPSLVASVASDRLLARLDTRVLASEWLGEHVPKGSAVAVLGTRFWIWGAPRLPVGARPISLKTPEDVASARRLDFVVTHEHALFSSRVDEAVWRALAPFAELVAEFDPNALAADGGSLVEPVFENADAYYVPIADFDAVERPGPLVRIYRMRGRGAAPSRSIDPPGSAELR